MWSVILAVMIALSYGSLWPTRFVCCTSGSPRPELHSMAGDMTAMVILMVPAFLICAGIATSRTGDGNLLPPRGFPRT